MVGHGCGLAGVVAGEASGDDGVGGDVVGDPLVEGHDDIVGGVGAGDDAFVAEDVGTGTAAAVGYAGDHEEAIEVGGWTHGGLHGVVGEF
jgi:hypothetical protein